MTDAVLFHTHGLGKFDFSNMSISDLFEIDDLAAKRSVFLCPTIFLSKNNIHSFSILLKSFSQYSKDNLLPRIIGFSIEGPMLGQNGGTPSDGVWEPNLEEWLEIISWFDLGLKYIVLSPDGLSLNENLIDGFTLGNLLDSIYIAGGRVALGHFSHEFPEQSAKRIANLLDYIEKKYHRSPYLILTDHFLNDMPRNFKHAFRHQEECEIRDIEISRFLNTAWQDHLLTNILGSVPATLLLAAKEGRLSLALNFDGLHVDLAICQRIVQYLGGKNIIAMTDHTEINSILGELLSSTVCSGLLYQGNGVLAASATTHEQQLDNMRSIDICPNDIELMFYRNPLEALKYKPISKSVQTEINL